MTFAMFNSSNGVGQVGGTLTNLNTGVTNGLFSLTLDFGSGVFSGGNVWLQMSVRTNGGTNFTTLAPRQSILPVPYAVFANTASNLLGSVPASQLNGTITLAQLPGIVLTNNASGVNLNGTLNGNATTATTASNVTGNIADSQLSANIAQLNRTNNFTGTNIFFGLTIVSNANNVFKGSFTGNGAGLTNVPGIMTWKNIVTGGSSIQTQTNTGYLATYYGTETTFILPTSPNVGDIVRVTGSGPLGWVISQNAGQSVKTGNFSDTIGTVWTPHDSSREWQAVASSADGSKLIAADQNGNVNGGRIYTSTDSGITWTPRESYRYWSSVATSSDGSKLVAVVGVGQIYTSTNSGVTWTARSITNYWSAVASSVDGSKLVSTVTGGQIYTSTDSGATWTPRDSARPWKAVASSADGTKLIAATGGDSDSGQIYTSADSGVTWTPRESSRSWTAVATSDDGSKLVAVAWTGSSSINPGGIFTSTDSGVTWTLRSTYFGAVFNSVTSSSDGRKLVAGSFINLIFTSTDSGATWAGSAALYFAALASSSDGNKLVGCAFGGQIYTSVPGNVASTTSGVTGYLRSGPNSAIELQYIGSGQWLPLNYIGVIRAY